MRMSVLVRMESPCAAAISGRQRCMLRCVRVRGADCSGWAARKPMRRTGASIGGRAEAGPSGAGYARGLRRHARRLPVPVLVNRLQKEHPP